MNDSITRRKLIEQAWTAAWDDGNVDDLDSMLAPGYVRHGSTGHRIGKQEFTASILSTRSAFPDLETVVDEIVIEGDNAAIRWHSEGTHTGPFLGIPVTGREVQVSGATFSKFSGDLIVEEFVTWDPRALLGALNVISIGQD